MAEEMGRKYGQPEALRKSGRDVPTIGRLTLLILEDPGQDVRSSVMNST